jgi:hypothetical protein
MIRQSYHAQLFDIFLICVLVLGEGLYTNRHYDYDIFNGQINIHLEVRHKVIGIKRCVSTWTHIICLVH